MSHDTPSAAPSLTTERLCLRGHRLSDFDAYAAFYASERATHIGGPYTPSRAWASFAADLGHWVLMGFGWWIVTDKGDPGSHPLGTVGLHCPPNHPEPEIGWTLFAGAEGKGFAHEAAAGVLAWGWQHRIATSLVSYIAPANARSIALAERLGAHLDAVAPKPAHAPDVLVYRHSVPAEVCS
ncbi:MAG: GNAT family N-acetyltransferase [Pseudomonadota bacterium]